MKSVLRQAPAMALVALDGADRRASLEPAAPAAPSGVVAARYSRNPRSALDPSSFLVFAPITPTLLPALLAAANRTLPLQLQAAGSGKRAGVLALARPHRGRPARFARINPAVGVARPTYPSARKIDELLKQRTGRWRGGYACA